MKKFKILFILLLIILVVLWVFFFLNNKVFNEDNSKDNKEVITEKDKKQLIDDITNDINNDYNNKPKDTEEKSKEYDQYFVATGYSGASDNVYYTKDGVLYHLSISTGDIKKVAEGVSKIENGKGTIIVYKGNGFKIFEEDSYLDYVD